MSGTIVQCRITPELAVPSANARAAVEDALLPLIRLPQFRVVLDGDLEMDGQKWIRSGRAPDEPSAPAR